MVSKTHLHIQTSTSSDSNFSGTWLKFVYGLCSHEFGWHKVKFGDFDLGVFTTRVSDVKKKAEVYKYCFPIKVSE